MLYFCCFSLFSARGARGLGRWRWCVQPGCPVPAGGERPGQQETQGSILLLATGRVASTLLLPAGQGVNGAGIHPGRENSALRCSIRHSHRGCLSGRRCFQATRRKGRSRQPADLLLRRASAAGACWQIPIPLRWVGSPRPALLQPVSQCALIRFQIRVTCSELVIDSC